MNSHRRHQTALRMAPADQRFGAAQAAVGELDLRLVEQLELAALDGERELGSPASPALRAPGASHSRTSRGRRAAVPWRGRRQMAVAQQLIGVAAVFRIDRNAGDDLDAMLARPASSGCVEGLDDALGKLADAARQRPRAASQWRIRRRSGARPGRRCPASCFSRSATALQHAVAAGVAQHVVDLLESVETEHQQRDPVARTSSVAAIIAARPACSVLRLASPVSVSYSAR